MADLPIALSTELADQLALILDAEGKIPRALDALGPLAARDVVLLGADGDLRRTQLAGLGARVSTIAWPLDRTNGDGEGGQRSGGGADAAVAMWTSFRGVDSAELSAAEGLLRPGGRLLVVHDYGRDDVSRLRGDQPEYGLWSRRDGPFLRGGFRVRVVHCWWTFDSVDAAREFLVAAFGQIGEEVATELRRPRLSYNVAIYHRTKR